MEGSRDLPAFATAQQRLTALPTLDAEYVLPLRWSSDDGLAELTGYLRRLSRWIEVTVVDGSDEPLFRAHARSLPPEVRHCRPTVRPGLNGKVAGVMTGVQLARSDNVVLADDDVRYERSALREVVTLLASADLVRPQNYFDPVPWHAAWDGARTLINRSFGSDYPGTLGVRRSTLLRAGGYDGNVLFENLELIRTIRAAGGTEVRADSLYVRRVPPRASTFFRQRVRQAYDDFAQPTRLVVELSLLPVIVWSLRRPKMLIGLASVVTVAAYAGRARARGATVFPLRSVAMAPVWMLERAVCVWLAASLWMVGGVSYSGRRIRRAGNSVRALRRRIGTARRANAGENVGGRP